MVWTTALAIYVLFWVLSAFLVMPFGVRTSEEVGQELVPGQSASAPHEFKPLRLITRTTVLAAVLFGAFYANYVNGWVGPEIFDFLKPPE